MAATRELRGPGRRASRRRASRCRGATRAHGALRTFRTPRTFRPPPATEGTHDFGFTLIETVLALVLLAMIMSSMAVLLLNGLRHGSALQRRQVAVTLAAQALEAARALSVVPDQNGCVKLLQGRMQAAVDQQWVDAPVGFTGVTDEVWTSNLCTGPVLLPFQGLPATAGTATDPVVVGGQQYTVQNYVGTCALNNGRTACVTSAAAPAGAPKLYRVLADVSWSGTGCSDPNGCDYSASTILDPSTDPLFNVRNATGPVATPDTICLTNGTARTIDIVANDTGSLAPTPVTIVSPPSKGTLASSITSGVGGYTPSGGATGTDSFTYYVSDVNGLVSNTVTVTLQIGGC